jgi:uncharacterized membrane protein
MLTVLSIRARQTGKELDLISQMEWVGSRIGGPATLITLASGSGMVLLSDGWTFGQPWVLGGLGILFLLFLVGVGFHGPQFKRIRSVVQKEGDESARADRLIQQSFMMTRFEILALALAMFLMVFKPGQ